MGTVYTQLSMQERRRIEDWWLAKVPVAEMARALALIKESYPDFGPTLAEYHGFKVSRETLRKWMVEDGIWLSRKQRRRFH
jgi:hypothetical protein